MNRHIIEVLVRVCNILPECPSIDTIFCLLNKLELHHPWAGIHRFGLLAFTTPTNTKDKVVAVVAKDISNALAILPTVSVQIMLNASDDVQGMGEYLGCDAVTALAKIIASMIRVVGLRKVRNIFGGGSCRGIYFELTDDAILCLIRRLPTLQGPRASGRSAGNLSGKQPPTSDMYLRFSCISPPLSSCQLLSALGPFCLKNTHTRCPWTAKHNPPGDFQWYHCCLRRRTEPHCSL